MLKTSGGPVSENPASAIGGEQDTQELEAEIVDRQAEASERGIVMTRTLAKHADERGKLLQAFDANAIPLDLLKSEQDRILVAERAARSELGATEGALDLKARPSVR